jgi:hypothetical protein
VKPTKEQIEGFKCWMMSKADDPGRGSMVDAVCALALRGLSAPDMAAVRAEAGKWKAWALQLEAERAALRQLEEGK